MQVTAVCKPSDGGWDVSVPEVEGASLHVGQIRDVAPSVADLVSERAGIPAADVRVTFAPTIYELLNPHRVYLPSPFGRWAAPGVTGTCRCGWTTPPYWMSDNAGEAVAAAYDHVATATGKQPLVLSTSNQEITIDAGRAAFNPSLPRPNSYTVRRR